MGNEIRIRQYQTDDVDRVYEAVMESKVELSRWMPWCHANYSRNDSITWVESRPSAWESGDAWSYVIEDGAGVFLGACGIHRIEKLNGVGELGFWIRSSKTRQGIATEATRQLSHWAFTKAGLHRIEILASVENLASQRVAHKAGAVHEGILRQRFVLNGKRHDCVLFSIVKGE